MELGLFFSFGKENKECPNPPSPSTPTFGKKENHFVPPKTEVKNHKASPMKFIPMSEKPQDFWWECGQSFSEMNDHILRDHPEKLDDESKLRELESKIKKVEGEVFRCSTFANSINPGNFNQSNEKRDESAIGCLVKLNKSFE